MKRRRTDIILTVLVLLTFYLILQGIDIYRLTIINSKYLLGFSIAGGCLGFVVLHVWTRKMYSLFLIFLIGFTIGAGLFYAGLLFFNQTFADKESVTKEFTILKTGNFAGKRGSCLEPYAIVDFQGTRKQLIFSCEYEHTIKSYQKVTLTYRNGFFGFETIIYKELAL